MDKETARGAGLKKYTMWLPEADMVALKTYYPSFGGQSRVVRALISRHIRRLQSKTAETMAARGADPERLEITDITGE